ncbi:hypothetical protein ES703_80078 [subsurface metagenome]
MEIKFKRDTTFRKLLFSPDSFAHPAKMDAQLLLWITERYTKPGETILDPMAGSGTTMLACMLSRNVVLVELEDKFCKMCQDNWELVRMRPQLGVEMGNCQIIQGDARNLEGLLADSIVTSPPYSDSPAGGGLNVKPPRPGTDDQSGRSPGSPSQAGAGKYDKVITSPPYAEASQFKDLDWINREQPRLHRPQVDKIVTSPPYSETEATQRLPDIPTSKGGQTEYEPQSLETNIGNLPYGEIDSIITSPPYEGSLESGSRHTKGGIADRDKKLTQTGTYADLSHQEKRRQRLIDQGHDPKDFLGGKARNAQIDWEYSGSDENIGNLKSNSYLEAMLQVYRQCYKVLKPGGLAIIVTKNFIREKKVVRLDLDTIKLCEKSGFSFIERHFRKLPGQSFWRITYKKKYPDVETLDTEEVMVFQKPQEAPEGF